MTTTTPAELPLEVLKKHYAGDRLLPTILQAFEKAGKAPDTLTAEDFAGVAAFHLRGQAATAELAGRMSWSQDFKVLDIGCGIGGSARYIAQKYGCAVTGIDMVEEYIEIAKTLTTHSHLDNQPSFRQASALSLPFADGSFDLVWTEHVQMNIADKKRLYDEIFRVLTPKGTLLFHDIFEERGMPYAFPLPWADNAAMNFLTTQQESRQLLDSSGFQIADWEDTSEKSREWYRQMAAKKRKKVISLPGVQLLMGHNARQKITNLIENLENNRLSVCQAVIRKK